jgi:hypothetical protein
MLILERLPSNYGNAIADDNVFQFVILKRPLSDSGNRIRYDNAG